MNDKNIIMCDLKKYDRNLITKLDIENYESEELAEFDKKLEEYKFQHKMYVRVLAVKMVKTGLTRIEVGKYLNVDRQTIGRWVKKYDYDGFEGLEPNYSNCGKKSKLSKEQLMEIKEIITDPKEHYDIKRTQK